MKGILLFIAAGLLITITAQANEICETESNDFKINEARYRNAQPVLFTYNNIDYAIFPNGKIEFELPYRNSRSSINRRGVRRCPATFDTIYHTSNRNYNRRTIRYNRYGQVSQIGPTHISYNRRNIVSRVGGLDILYRNGVVRKVGGLKVLYNRRGQIVAARGHVLARNFYGHGHHCNDHNFGVFNEYDNDVNQGWDNGIYFKRKPTT
jgi:hypothetical protein